MSKKSYLSLYFVYKNEQESLDIQYCILQEKEGGIKGSSSTPPCRNPLTIFPSGKNYFSVNILKNKNPIQNIISCCCNSRCYGEKMKILEVFCIPETCRWTPNVKSVNSPFKSKGKRTFLDSLKTKKSSKDH